MDVRSLHRAGMLSLSSIHQPLHTMIAFMMSSWPHGWLSLACHVLLWSKQANDGHSASIFKHADL